ncbi:hypothetical protein P0W64_10275 [Tsukamurella sp. 8F]|uniref:hypothetical protein n=1 Tax=unclassified Tsukamurella TaxID=2633480 RepID=UPI0023B8F25F|nr:MULTISPECIES: hypothetical protein [unclassified Tsukamurella]MDF0529336.1 hypothetical protein [Tsukamurella sp. 8J]MDF0587157.1 hypothetical protein [Tsukamurella sp. 8F]
MTHPTEPLPPVPPNRPRRIMGRRTRIVAVCAAAGLTLCAAGATGAGIALASSSHETDAAMSSQMSSPAPADKKRHTKTKLDAAHKGWAHKYGHDAASMPNLPDVAAASDAQRAAAADLLQQSEADTAKYSDVTAAKAAGYDLDSALKRAEKKRPALAKHLKRVDAGATPKMMPMLHVANVEFRKDGKVLDPNAPETLMYEYQAGGHWKLIGVMYTAAESYPAAPPTPGGPITRWHYHSRSGGASLMMHVFFVPGNDLAHAFAREWTP